MKKNSPPINIFLDPWSTIHQESGQKSLATILQLVIKKLDNALSYTASHDSQSLGLSSNA